MLVVDDLQDAPAPLTAVARAGRGCTSRLVTRWPMIGMETIPEVYYLWMRQQLYAAERRARLPDHFVAADRAARGSTCSTSTCPERVDDARGDWIVMETGRQSENALYHGLRERGASVEMIGDAVAPRGTYDAVFEGHRQARKL